MSHTELLFKFSDLTDIRNLFWVKTFTISDTGATPRHTHNFFEICFITGGSIIHILNGRANRLEKRSFFFITPEDSHYFEKIAGEPPAVMMYIGFTMRAVPKFLRHYFLPGSSKIPNEHTGCDTALFLHFSKKVEQINNILSNQGSNNNTENSADAQLLFTGLISDLSLLRTYHTPTDLIPRWLSEACTEMKQKQNYNLGSRRLMEISGKSSEHLSRCVRKYYGTTPSDLINKIRLEECGRLLTSCNKSVLSIMTECGFNNAAHFNKCFKSLFNMTPANYRKLNRVYTGSQE